MKRTEENDSMIGTSCQHDKRILSLLSMATTVIMLLTTVMSLMSAYAAGNEAYNESTDVKLYSGCDRKKAKKDASYRCLVFHGAYDTVIVSPIGTNANNGTQGDNTKGNEKPYGTVAFHVENWKSDLHVTDFSYSPIDHQQVPSDAMSDINTDSPEMSNLTNVLNGYPYTTIGWTTKDNRANHREYGSNLDSGFIGLNGPVDIKRGNTTTDLYAEQISSICLTKLKNSGRCDAGHHDSQVLPDGYHVAKSPSDIKGTELRTNLYGYSKDDESKQESFGKQNTDRIWFKSDVPQLDEGTNGTDSTDDESKQHQAYIYLADDAMPTISKPDEMHRSPRFIGYMISEFNDGHLDDFIYTPGQEIYIANGSVIVDSDGNIPIIAVYGYANEGMGKVLDTIYGSSKVDDNDADDNNDTVETNVSTEHTPDNWFESLMYNVFWFPRTVINEANKSSKQLLETEDMIVNDIIESIHDYATLSHYYTDGCDASAGGICN